MTAARTIIAQLEALDAEQMRRASKDDPAMFARSTGFTADPWQTRVLSSKSRRVLLNCCRQSGKSTTSALLALHQAVFTPSSLVLLMSPSERQSAELLRKVSSFVAKTQMKAIRENQSSLELTNGSRIISLPATENTIRGYSAVNLIVEDEAGDVDDELHAAVLPMIITSRGRLVMAGTPKGRRGHFFEAWERGGDAWERIAVRAEDCPRIPPEDLEQQRIMLRDLYPQEYECQFISAGGGLVYAGFDERRNLVDELPPCSTWRYLLGLDFGFNDATAFVILGFRPDDTTAYIHASFKESGLTPSRVGEKVSALEKTYRFDRIIGDTGGLGKGYSEELRRRFRLPIEVAEKTNKRGYIDLLNGDLHGERVKMLRSANAGLVRELTNLPWNMDRTKEHSGFENHLCDALLYVWRSCTTYLQTRVEPPAPLTPEQQIRADMAAFWEKDEARRKVEKVDLMGGFSEGLYYTEDEL